jgi:hypothetical protein
MAGYRRHVFVCLNERDPSDPKGCCKHRGSDEVFKTLKAGAHKPALATCGSTAPAVSNIARTVPLS